MNAPASIFIADAPQERKVTLGDGTEHAFFFREIPNTEFELYAIHAQSNDEEVASRAAARLVAQSLCDENGKLELTTEQAGKLKRPIMVAMLAHVFEVNGLTKAVGAKSEKEAAAKKP